MVFSLNTMGSPGPCLAHRHIDGVVRRKDRDHGPEEEQQPLFADVYDLVVALTAVARLLDTAL